MSVSNSGSLWSSTEPGHAAFNPDLNGGRNPFGLIKRANGYVDMRDFRCCGSSSGLPHCRQKPRSTTADDLKDPGVPRVQAKFSKLTEVKGAKNEPAAFWHMRQWQICGLNGSA